jgi:two-component system, sensor histidine kinase
LLESKKTYVRHISHELRTPLNTAFLGLKLLSSELKASNDPRDKERYDTLVDVNMSCMAAVDILNDLLCYEKLESGILELHKEEIVVDSFLNNCVSMFSAQARECGVTMAMIIKPTERDIERTSDDGNLLSSSILSTDSIFADKFKMDQVIRNLMSNALKFTPRGGHVTVKAFFQESAIESAMYQRNLSGSAEDFPHPVPVSRKSGKFMNVLNSRKLNSIFANVSESTGPKESFQAGLRGKLVVVVTDTGAGISEENQARLFNEIVQFNPEKLQAGGGSGLGLWITQEILNLHGGSISVSSEGEGKGSSFTVEMPMIRQHQTALPSPELLELDSSADECRVVPELDRELTMSDIGDSPLLPLPFELLVVDDSRLCRKMLQKCLRADGHTCTEAQDGLEAVAMVKKRIGHANGGNGKPFDAILIDFIMPNMDGPTATKEIRALGYTAPIFGVTGNGEFQL